MLLPYASLDGLGRHSLVWGPILKLKQRKPMQTRKLLLAVLLLGAGLTLLSASYAQTPTPTAPDVGRRAGNAAEPTPQLTNADGSCTYAWAFDIQSTEAACPAAEAETVEAVFQPFQYGFMVWTEPNDTIYVLHHTAAQPRWVAAQDAYVSGMPERDNDWPEAQPPQTNQPRLGFGVLWRQNDDIRERIGWAVQTWETVYEARLQSGADGTIYIEEPGGGVLALLPGAQDWKLYTTD